ncbi:MAG: flexitail domain-containing putative surface protein, partial [Dehalococcoidia bacterium]
ELAVTPPGTCGDDPYNPSDSDTTLTNTGSVVVTVAPADWDKTEDGGGAGSCRDGIDNGGADGADAADPNDCMVIPGVFFSCATSASVAGAAATIRAHCYTNAPALTINCEDVSSTSVTTCASGNTCPPAAGPAAIPPGGQCGDGTAGGGPRHDPTPAAPNNAGFGDVDSVANGGHTVLNGTIAGNVITFSGCFQHVENAIQGPSIYATGTIDLNGGLGSVTIYTAQTPAACKAGTPTGSPPAVPLEFAEQPQNFDHDRDNCATVDELGKVPGSGGLRDPLNFWDMRTVTTGVTATSQGSKDRAVAVGDITAIVGRFGTNDSLGAAALNRYSKAKGSNSTIPVTGYHPQYDSGGGLVGSAGGWNVKGPDGAVAVGDISAIVAQFGHNCPTNPIVQ